ncbi:MAG: sodium-dependent transporter [Oscillospiraceae bacterium]
MESSRNSFTGSIGFVLAAAGSAVGLGNIWRFPYLAAKDGGGLFLVAYIIMALTFGFTLLTAEIAIGRKTKQSPLTAYDKLKKGWKPLGVIACFVPVLILPYYVTIGGWVLKYFIVYLTGGGTSAAADGYFGGFISQAGEPIIFMAIFLAAVAAVILMGVDKGIEASSKIIMPILLILVVAISVFTLTISYTDADGNTRTGLEGLKIYVVPSLEGMTFKSVFTVIMDAVGQLFFSLSVAMGIMITYGSYVNDSSNLSKSINQIEIFDTIVAFLAGVMIIPAVYTFEGREGMSASGPSLMFVSLPKVFNEMGTAGNIIGCLFFVMVFFAALSSGISIMEAIVSSFMDEFGISRMKAALLELCVALIGGILVCLGYNKLYFEVPLPNGSTAQILDIMDYISNNIFMPLVAIGTCILVGWILKPDLIISEIEKNNVKMGRKKMFAVMIKFIAPILLLIILLKSVGVIKFL